MTRMWPEEAERSVLSAVLSAASFDAGCGLRVLRKARGRGLHPTDFGLASYGVIYEAMLRLEADGLPVDPVSLAAELDQAHTDPRAVAKLHALAHEVACFTAVGRYADIVVRARARRELEERTS